MPRISALYGIVKRLVVEWARAHQSELRENWVRARHHESLTPIEPLR
jgi:hypothetical protein